MFNRNKIAFLPGITKMESRPDEILVEEFRKSGNPEAMAELFRRYTHLVYGVCLKYLGNEEESKDAVMQIFEFLYTNLSKHEVVNFKGWLYTVSRNHCLMQLRQNKKKKHVISSDLEKNNPVDVELEPEWHLNIGDPEKDETFQLKQAIEDLHPDQKICIELMYLQEKTYKEIAEITGFSMNQVKSFIQNGKRNLKIKLEDYED